MKFTRSEAEKKQVGDSVTQWEYNKRHQFAGATVTYLEVTASHGLVLNKTSDRVYYVLEGNGEFILRGESLYVAPTDVVMVPMNTEHDFWAAEGQILKLLLVHAPGYDPESDVRPDR